MILLGPGVNAMTAPKTTKAANSDCDMLPHAIPGKTGFDEAFFDEACGRFDSNMMAIPQTTVTMPASRNAPNRSPKITLDDAAPMNGTSNANGTTWAVV